MIDADEKIEENNVEDNLVVPSSSSRAGSRRYMFDRHFFDMAEKVPEEEEIDIPPPPPTFSEEELAGEVEKAKSSAFAQGKQEAAKEALGSLEREAKNALDVLSKQLADLMKAEQDRDRQFQEDVLKLTHIIIQKLFPALSATQGLDDIESFVGKILAKQDKKAEMNVRVPVRIVDEMTRRINENPDLADYLVYVKGDPSLGAGDCRIEWKDGGAIRDGEALYQSIVDLLPEFDVLPKSKSKPGPGPEQEAPPQLEPEPKPEEKSEKKEEESAKDNTKDMAKDENAEE